MSKYAAHHNTTPYAAVSFIMIPIKFGNESGQTHDVTKTDSQADGAEF